MNFYCCIKQISEGLKTSAIIVGVGNELVKIQHQLLGRLNITYVTLQSVQRISAITYNSYTSKSLAYNFLSLLNHLNLLFDRCCHN
jgi:hypothetical protein